MSQTKAQLINAVDGSIVTADLADDAVTAAKLAHTSVTAGSYTTADITVDAQGRITAAASGTISGAEIADQAVTNAKVNDSAAIAGTKISPDFGSQAISTTGTGSSLGRLRISNVNPFIELVDTNNNSDFSIRGSSGNFVIRDDTNAASRLTINSSGTVDVAGNLDVGAGIDVTGAITGTAGLSIEGATVFNDAGADVDFRIEGDTDPFLFNADAGNDRIGINAQLPRARLHVSNDNHLSALSLSSGTQIVASGTGNASAFIGISILGGNSTGASILNLGDIDDEDAGQIFYSHLDNSLRINTNASERMRIDSSGNVGIGTTSPGTILHISQTNPELRIQGTNGSGGVHKIFSAGVNSESLQLTGASNLLFNADTQFFRSSDEGTEYMRIDSSGRLGIGTTTPSAPLHIQKSGTNQNLLTLESDLGTNNNRTLIIGGPTSDSGTAPFRLSTANSLSFTIDGVSALDIAADKKIGIGTASPVRHLDINDSSHATLALTSTTQSSLFFADDDTNIGQISYNHPSNYLYFRVNDAERVRIDSSGNVGIGTTSPSQKLDVSGNLKITSGLALLDNDQRVQWGSSNVSYIEGNDDSHILFGVAAEVMRLTSTGLGIGTNSPTCALHIDNPNNAAISQILDTDNSAVKLVFRNNTETGNNMQIGADGSNLVALTAATERMRIKSDGDVLLTRQTAGGGSNETLLISANYGAGSDQALQASNNLRFYSGGANERLRITSTGNIAIANSSPGARLDVSRLGSAWTGPSPIAGTTILAHSGTTGTTSPSYLNLAAGNASISGIHFGDTDDIDVGVFQYTHSDNQFQWRTNGGGIDMVLDSVGRIGLGLTDPDTDLVIQKTSPSLKLTSTSTVGNTNLYFGDTSNNTQGQIQFHNNGDFFRVYIGGSEHVRIDSSGRVGIGTSDLGSHRLISSGGKAESGGSCLALKTAGGANSITSALALYGTFVTPTSDQATRRTADIVSGFSTANWGNEFLAFHVGKGGSSNDAQAVTDERMRIDGSGKVGISTTAPQVTLDVGGASSGGIAGLNNSVLYAGFTNNTNFGGVVLGAGANGNTPFIAASKKSDGTVLPLDLMTNALSRVRIATDGGVFFGITSNPDSSSGGACFRVNDADRRELLLATTTTATRALVEFINGNGSVGSISVSGSNTSYNTSSDYRLKENVTPISDGITRLKTLKPSRFNFKADSSTTVDGFLAHEVTAVPEAITGTKDEVATEDTVSHKKGDPIYQSIDQSKLVPLLVAAVQELIGKVEILEAA